MLLEFICDSLLFTLTKTVTRYYKLEKKVLIGGSKWFVLHNTSFTNVFIVLLTSVYEALNFLLRTMYVVCMVV